MTPMHPDLMKHSTHAVPTSHEREAVRVRRHARRHAFLALVDKVFSHIAHHQLAPTRKRVNSPS
jgi:hypothetical protein